MDSPTTEDGNPFGDIPTRPMRVKVLYTFDYENKTNCLARFPDTLQIPAVAIDDNAQVGVIELRQCIQAIVAASPELLSRLAEGDFTIYAYDYSEYETPLVGQGMLSVALSASAPLVPAHQSKTMITGRVCKNLPALFSNGVKETLEVKLRLVPVPKQVQNEYVRSMESLRSQSPAMSAGFDPNAWNASLNPGSLQQNNADYFQFDIGTPGSQQDQSLIDDIFGLRAGDSGENGGQQMLGGVGIGQTPSGCLPSANPAFASHPHSAPGSRAGSPIMPSGSSVLNEQLRHQSFSSAPPNFGSQSRPDSRASVRSESYAPSHSHQRQPSTHSVDLTQQIENFYNEDGQPRKRAKVMQADWRGKSSFGGKSSDLRVTAATAASMQMHRPIPTRPTAPGSNLEPPPRVPTPTPQLGVPAHQRPRIPSSRSMLRQASTTGSDFLSDVDQMSEAVMSSPEDGSPENSVAAGETPQEFPSSPPLFPGMNQPTPSSPGLPTLPAPGMADSGYMSERNFNSSTFPGNLEGEPDETSPDAQEYSKPAQARPGKQRRKTHIKSEGLEAAKLPPPYPSDAPTSELNFEWEQPGDMNQLPQKMLLNLPPGRGVERPSTAKRASRTNSPAPRSMTPMSAANENTSRAPSLAPAPALMQRTASTVGSVAPESRRGSLVLPTKRAAPADDASDNAAPPAKKRQTSRRAYSAHPDSEAGSPAPSDTEGRPAGPNRSGSGAQRRKIIEQRMHDAVAKGEMPQYCVHCGAIETPTWRKLYFRIVEGKPGPLDSVEDEGETIGVAPLEWNDAGDVSKFIIRKSMKKAASAKETGPGFEEVVICNPCGLWFKKNRSMRPKDRWGKKSAPRKSRKNRVGETGYPTDSVEPESEAFFTDAVMPEELPQESIAEAQIHRGFSEDQLQPAPTVKPRAHSMQAQQRPDATSQWDPAQLNDALQRAIQSSPGRFHGSQDSPIEIEELTPKPTRRMLFPSPRQEGQMKSIGDKTSSSGKASPVDGDKQAALSKVSSTTPGQNDVAIFEAFTLDKENMPPPFHDDDELAHLFDGSPTSLFRTPGKTPRKTPGKGAQPSIDQLLKTPTPASRRRKLLTPSAAAANNANQQTLAGNDFMTSPGSSRYFLRSTPTRLANTPGRRSALGSDTSQQVSPFSRHLSQLLNNATGESGDCFTSPTSGLDFSDLPTFTTPGRWEGLMSSDFGVFEDGQA